jgi:hypothetical protein
LLLANWWGGTWENYVFLAEISSASNIFIGGNPPYQISDFLCIYPKFGKDPQNISTVSIGAGGQNYLVNDILVPVQQDSSGAQLKVISVDGGGAVTDLSVVATGVGYSVATGLATTGGAGTGALVNITAISQFQSAGVPQVVLQMYINLASAALQKARWQDSWLLGMALFVAHYATLYLRSEGNAGSTPQQIASSGLALGLTVSKAAGDVSQTQEYLTGWEDWGSWGLTLYGQQLITLAKIIGMGPMYIW